MKHLLLFTLLMKTLVTAHADPANEQPKLEFPEKDHLTARQLYEITDRMGVYATQVGQFVVLDVVVKIARDVPLVEIERPEELAAGSKPVISASVISATTAASSWKTGDRFRIEGIVVGKGYGAYTIYLLNYKEGKGLANAPEPSAEDLALVKGLILTGTVKQAIGGFGGFSQIDIGTTFELDLSNLPKEKIDFTPPPSHPEGLSSEGGYIPLHAPIKIVKVKKEKEGHVSIDFSSSDPRVKFFIQIDADLPPNKSNSAYVTFYGETEGGLIGSRSMVEAVGALKVKDSVPSDLQPEASEPVRQPDAKEKSPIFSPEMGTNATAEQVAVAKLQGAETAAADIKAGIYRILYYGEPYPLKPLVDEATGYRVQIVAGCVVGSQFVAETDAYNQAMHDWHAKSPLPNLWPPPLDEKRLIGTWARKNQPIQGVENHTLLILQEDHSWTEAEISGPLTDPVRIKKFATDSIWEVVNVDGKNTKTMLLFKYKERGSNVWDILMVGASELDFSGFGGAIIDFKHYTRCEAQTAAKLYQKLNQKETEATSK